jgi:hypothetical protein
LLLNGIPAGGIKVYVTRGKLIFGKIVAGIDKTGTMTVEIPGIKTGMYVMQVTNKTRVRTTRFVVQALDNMKSCECRSDDRRVFYASFK